MNFDVALVWLRRLISLDITVFDDIRSDPMATIPGVLIVTVAMFIAGIGGWLWWWMGDYGANGDIFVHSVIIGSLIAVVLWGLVWLGLVYVILTQVFRERAYIEQLLRVMGLASAPLALMGLMFIPGVSFGIGLASLALTFGLTGIAIKSATTADQAQVLVANLVGFFFWAAVLTLLAASSSGQPHAPGVFLYQTAAGVLDDILSISSG